MQLRNVVLGAIVIACLVTTGANAQSTLREGAKVRITSANEPRVTGVVQRVTPDSVFLFTEPQGGRLGIARSQISAVQMSAGRSVSRGALKGTAWGLGLAALTGGIVVATVGRDDNYSTKYSDGSSATSDFWSGLLGGAIIGAGVGAVVRSESWTDVTLRPGISAESAGIRVGFSFR